EHGEQEHRLVVAEEGDALAFGDAKRCEPSGDVLDLLLKLPISPVAALEIQRLALGRAQRPLGEPMAEADVRRHGGPPVCLLLRVSAFFAKPSNANFEPVAAEMLA